MIVLGRITAPFGVLGWVKVHPFGDDPDAWKGMPRWWLGADGNWQAYELRECAAHGKGLIARFEGIGDRGAAEQLAGLYVGAPREALPETGESEFYWADLVGLDVVNLAEESLGKVAGLLSAGAHEVLRVRDEQDNERLLPFVAAIVKEVDLAGRKIHVDWGRDW
ncbi:MAG: ribosome maturation factor RimM [Rhodocyclales bacterium]|nr:ribosome maturation factor RimM [Rhodocyclales bacterium]